MRQPFLFPLCGLLTLWLCLLVGNLHAQCIDTYEPGCKLPIELGQAQRNCIDPTKYWLCPAAGGSAISQRCASGTAFDQDKNACIPWILWVWKPCIEPPSRPNGVQPCGN